VLGAPRGGARRLFSQIVKVDIRAAETTILVQTLSNAAGWTAIRMALEAYLLYAKGEEGIAWRSGITQIDRVKAVYDVTLTQNAQLPVQFPALSSAARSVGGRLEEGGGDPQAQQGGKHREGDDGRRRAADGDRTHRSPRCPEPGRRRALGHNPHHCERRCLALRLNE